MYKIVPPIANLSHSKKLTIQDMFNIGGQDNFLIGKNKMLHGGVHLKGSNSQNYVQSIGDGKIIAYKIDSDYKKYNPDPKNPSLELEFSSSFVLIEHNFEYPTDLESTNIFRGYKFYSLYMHLAPKNEYFDANGKRNEKKIPYYLSMKQNSEILKKYNGVLTIGEKIDFGKNAIYQGDFLDAKINSKMLDLWINKKNIRFYKNDPTRMELADNLDYVFLKNESNPNQFLSNIQFDKVVDLSSNPIDVKSGDLIGYLGKNIEENTQTKDGIIHFEIFCDSKNINFLDNNSRLISFSDPDLATLINSDSFLSGVFYKEKKGNSILKNYDQITYIGKQNADYEEFDISTLTTQTINANNYPKVCTDMDWLYGNNAWSKIHYLEFCDIDYTADIKNKIEKLSPNKRKQWLFVETHSEWAKKNIEKRYAVLKTGKKINKHIKIPKMNGNEFKNFIDYASGFCFWEEVKALPAFDSIVNFNPIYFLERLDRCFSPFSFISSAYVFEYLRYTINNSQILVEEKLNQLKSWKLEKFNSSNNIASEFKDWFGYQKNTNLSPSNLQSSIQITHVPTLEIAVNKIIYTLTKLNDFIKLVSMKNFISGISIENNYEQTYGFVFPNAKLNRPIFLAYQFVHDDIAIQNGIGVFNNLNKNNFSEQAVNTICHELSHFDDLGGLRDVFVIDKNQQQYGPYGDTECKDMAKLYPSASLMNADNLSFFIQGLNFRNEIFLY